VKVGPVPEILHEPVAVVPLTTGAAAPRAAHYIHVHINIRVHIDVQIQMCHRCRGSRR